METRAFQTGTPFPVSWDQINVPATFTIDPMHFPYPIAPLTSSAIGGAFSYGHVAACREYGLPIGTMTVIDVNHFRYEGFVRTGEEPPPDEQTLQQRMQWETAHLLERWSSEHLPALEPLLERIRAVDPRGKTTIERLAMLDELDRIHRRLWHIHFRIALPMLIGISAFSEFYAEVLGGEDADAHALLVGANSKSVAAGIALSDLANTARSHGLESAFRKTPLEDLMPDLERDDRAGPFLDQLRIYLDTYGLRQDLFDFEQPTWQEDPTVALAIVAAYLESGYDARAEQMELAGKADAAVQKARDQLEMFPRPVREQFEAMLQSGRHGAFLQEEHNFYIDQQGISLLRLAYLRFGRDLVDRDMLERAEDVFMLETGELREAVASADDPATKGTVRALIRQRKGEMEVARTLVPPPFLGPPPETPEAPNLLLRTMEKFFGGPPQVSDDPSQLLGSPGSRGVVTGRVRIAHSLAEAKYLEPGEILVATTTMPAWTPLYGTAAAVVTETGGSLSHCAIVAREYGIPAVVGVFGAMARISTGQEITFDGTRCIFTLN